MRIDIRRYAYYLSLFLIGSAFAFILHILIWIDPQHFGAFRNMTLIDQVLNLFSYVGSIAGNTAIIAAMEDFFFVIPALFITSRVLITGLKGGSLYRIIRYHSRTRWYVSSVLKITLGLLAFFTGHFVFLSTLSVLRLETQVKDQDIINIFALTVMTTLVVTIISIIINILSFYLHDILAVGIGVILLSLLIKLRINYINVQPDKFSLLSIINRVNPLRMYGSDIDDMIRHLPITVVITLVCVLIGYRQVNRIDLSI